jgi:hypothetical protein
MLRDSQARDLPPVASTIHHYVPMPLIVQRQSFHNIWDFVVDLASMDIDDWWWPDLVFLAV